MSKSYEVQGQIHSIDETKVYGQKGFSKREFVIKLTGEDENTRYPNYVALECTQDKCSLLDSFSVGTEINVHFNLSGRLWAGNGNGEKCFTNLQAWKIEAAGAGSQPAHEPPSSDFDEARYMPDLGEGNADEVPF